MKKTMTGFKIYLPVIPIKRRRKKHIMLYQRLRKFTKYKKYSRMRLIRNMAWICTATTAAALSVSERSEKRVQAHATTISSLPKHTYFDTDSYELYMDNCASRCITNDLRDFIDTPVPADVRIYQLKNDWYHYFQ
jgi:hypothetical protein